jgi:hypothetical protein
MRVMRMMTLSLCLALVACTDSGPAAESAPTAAPAAQPDQAAPAPSAAPAAATPSAAKLGEVDLTLTGAMEGTFRGAATTCSRFALEGQPGASVKVMSRDLGLAEDWDLTFLVTSEAEWETPSVILSVRGEGRASYTYPRKEPAGESVSVARDLAGADIDLTLKQLGGADKVRVKGTIRCPG